MCVNIHINITSNSLLPGCLFYLLSLFVSCSPESVSQYPATLDKSIDLFFIENKTDSVLKLLASDELIDQPKNIRYVCDIFKAAALSESGRADSAGQILRNIPINQLYGCDRYYYKSILGLTQFRLNNFQQAFHITSEIIEEKPYDIRCLALNERVMARTMSYYENYELAIRLFLKSSEHYQEMGLQKSIFVNEKFLASIYSQLGSYDEAIAKLNEAEKAFIAYNDLDELFYVYVVAIKTYLQHNQLESAQRYAKLAMESGNFTSDAQKMVSLYSYMGSINKRKGNSSEAIAMYEIIRQKDEEFFGSDRRKAEVCINLASVYNSINEVWKAEECAIQALDIIGNNKYNYLKYNAFKELSDVYLHTNPILAHTYMDSAQACLEKYHKLSTTGIVDLANTRFDLDGAINKINQLREEEQRKLIIFRFVIIAIAVLIIIYSIFSRMRKVIDKTLIELVKKNLTLLNHEQTQNKSISKQSQITGDGTVTPPIDIEQKASLLFHEFKEWLENDKMYLNSDLNLNQAARELGTNRSYLSNAINSQGIKFTELINKYRIQEVIRIFEDPDNPSNHFTLEELANEAGFHTKSVFFDAFRKETGMTPSQFREYIRYTKISYK